MKGWSSVDPAILRFLPHDMGALELKHKVPEVTFLGVRDQPDFAELFITMYPNERQVELRSLKEYIYAWRNVVVSYERFVDTVFAHMMEIYEPIRLRLVLVTRPRGGISSKITVDSDWAIRDGKEQFPDWVGMGDTW